MGRSLFVLAMRSKLSYDLHGNFLKTKERWKSFTKKKNKKNFASHVEDNGYNTTEMGKVQI